MSVLFTIYYIEPIGTRSTIIIVITNFKKQESVRPRWPYDMRPSVCAEKYIRDASGAEKT